MSDKPRLLRIFITKTPATPNDEDVVINDIPPLDASEYQDKYDEAHISVTFTWDKERAEELYEAWSKILPTKIGGVAYGKRSEEFVPGKYIKKGYVITSRGCPNKCWFCQVWKREGTTRILPIQEGSNLLDDNLLSCPDDHVIKTFEMLQRNKPVEFTGGLEAKLLKPWHCELLGKLKPTQVFFAYDTPDDLEPLIEAGKMLRAAGLRMKVCRCHVLMAYPGDTMEEAEKRLWQTIDAGFYPSAMVYRDLKGQYPDGWKKFQRVWQRPALIYGQIKNRKKNLCPPSP